jgi:hypothetical protein
VIFSLLRTRHGVTVGCHYLHVSAPILRCAADDSDTRRSASYRPHQQLDCLPADCDAMPECQLGMNSPGAVHTTEVDVDLLDEAGEPRVA